jgi:DNA repair protein RecN (Recombination protein N)
LGWRGRAELVRAGAAQGEVIAEFDLPAGHSARAVLVEAGFEDSDELILRRINTANGRKTAYVNDRRVSSEVLRDLSECLVELHGQNDDRGLLNPRGHRNLLDSFAGLDLTAVRGAWRARAQAREALAAARSALDRAQVEEDYLRHAVAELDKLNPEPGEEAILDTKRRAMQGAERIRSDVQRAYTMLNDGAESSISDALRWLHSVSDKAEGKLDSAIAALGRAMAELGDAGSNIADCLRQLDFRPGDLEVLEERLFAIRALARKHSVLADDLGGFAETLRARLAAIDGGAAGIAKLEKTATEAELAYQRESMALTKARKLAAGRLDKAMAAELAPLKMERAVFSTDLALGDAGPEGVDAVQFTVATNPGAPAGALNKIASGGELSRFLLALKVCLTANTPGLTMIFDEIDRGVGGATADAVGRRLQALASSAQVLVVTHSPQVAARGGHHWRVEKRVTKGQTLSTVVPLGADERVEEIARMLAGDTVTEAAREAARALLA